MPLTRNVMTALGVKLERHDRPPVIATVNICPHPLKCRHGRYPCHQSPVALQANLDDGALPDLKAMIERFRPKDAALPIVVVTLPSLAIYDEIVATMGEAA